MAARYSPTAIFNSVNNRNALTSDYKPFQRACGQQLDFTAVQQANPLNNTQVGLALSGAEPGSVIIPRHTEADLNKQLDILFNAAVRLGEKNIFARQSQTEVKGCYVSLQAPQRNPCTLNPSGQLNNPYNTFLNPSIFGNDGLVDNPQVYPNSLPEMVSQKLPQCQLHQGQLEQELWLEQERLWLVMQQNQHKINLLQQVQVRTPWHSQSNLSQEQVKVPGLLPYSFQDCNEIPVVSTANNSGASHGVRLAQIYADASRQTAMTDGLPYTPLNSELASLSQTSAKSRDDDEKLKQLFRRIDDMHAAMQRSEAENARRQPKRSRYVRKSPPRLKLLPKAHEEYIAWPGRGQNDNDHKLSTVSVSCASPEKAGLKKNSMSFVEHPCTSGVPSHDYFITDGGMVHETGSPNTSPTLQHVTLLQPARKSAHAQQNVLLIDSDNIKHERDCAKNALTHDTASGQHEASKLETASDVPSINERQEDLLSEFDLISFLCSESSPKDDLKTLEDCINFLMEPVLNLEPSVQGDQSAIVNSFEGEPPTIGGEMHNTLTTQPNFVTVSSNAFHNLEASNCVSAPQVACGPVHRDVSTCGTEQEVVSNCGAEQEAVSTCGSKQEILSTCGAIQEDVITVLLADPYKTVAFPDNTELEDAAIRMKFTYDFCNPEGISVFASCVEAALEDNLELLESCKKVLFTRLVDPQTSMTRERELGYPDLTEVINKMDELTEAVGGYWPVSDKCAWMLGFVHPNELLFLKSLMEPEWKTMMDTATTTEDILVSAYWGLCEFLTRFEGSEETKHASLPSNHNQGDTNGCDLGSDKFNASFENGAGLQEKTSLQMKRKREVDEDELYLPPRKRTTMGDGDFIF